jgi:iron complex transport system substrate-binding protein
LLFGSAKTYSFPLKVRDDLGREVEFVRKPERIVSLSPSHTEILFALGLGSHIIGVTDHCNYPDAVREKLRVGGFANPNIEKIVSLDPDLILAFGLVQKPIIRLLENRGKKTFWVNPHSIKDIFDSIERIGRITGAVSELKHLKQMMEERLRSLEEKLKDIPEIKRPILFRVMGFDPLGTVGGDSFQTDVFRLAGGKNVFGDIKRDYFEVDEKALFERNPDVIVICGEDEEKLKKRVREHPVLKNLSSVKRDRIFVISCDLICRPGPRVVEAIERISGYLYSERFLPQRIISLGPSISESIYLLGLGDRLVGVTTYCERPPDVRLKEKVGSVIEIDTEKILALKPDLVLATSLTNPKAVEKLRRLGIRVSRLSSPKNFEELCEQFLELGRISGREFIAREIVENVKAKVSHLRQGVKGLPMPKVFVQVGAKPLFTIPGDSLINDFIKFAGGLNIAQNSPSGFYTREEVLRSDPDVIIIVTMGISGEQEKEIWQRYRTLPAVKNNRIYIFDSYRLCSPTPVSFVETLEQIIVLLHPEKRS